MVGPRLHRVDQRQPGPPALPRALPAPRPRRARATTTSACPRCARPRPTLAAAHGISGFVYYHYWFHGKRLLERPFDEVLASGSPDFPFALCWANEEWTRNWDASTGRVLMPQEFSDADDLAHIRWLATAFADDRYIKIDGRPLMLIYRPEQLPDPKRTATSGGPRPRRLGFPDLYLCWVESWGPPPGGPEAFGLDATVGFMPFSGERLFEPRARGPGATGSSTTARPTWPTWTTGDVP